MAAPAKFTFDLDLARGPRAAAATAVDTSRLAEQLQQARAEGYAQGFDEGERGAMATEAHALTQAAETLVGTASAMLSGLEDQRRADLADAVELATTVGRKLAAHLMALQPTAEIEALIVECLTSIAHVPHLVIRCHPSLSDAIRGIAEARIAHSSFAGRLVVMGDPDIGLSDGRLEWVDGGLVRDVNAISAQIDERITAYLAARQPQGSSNV